MTPQFSDFRRMRRRVRRTLNYGPRQPHGLNLPLSEMVVDYFDKLSPFDYMHPETSTSISRKGYADPYTLVVAMVYLDRLRMSDKVFFEASDPTDLYLPALVLASKFLHDPDSVDRAANSDWAEAADISDSHLNNLEWEFIHKLDWKTMVKNEECERMLCKFERWVAADAVNKFGVCTYNELDQLSSGIARKTYFSILHDLFSFLGLSTVVYALSLLSLVGVPTVYQSSSLLDSPTSSANATCPSPAFIGLPSTSEEVVAPSLPVIELPSIAATSNVPFAHQNLASVYPNEELSWMSILSRFGSQSCHVQSNYELDPHKHIRSQFSNFSAPLLGTVIS